MTRRPAPPQVAVARADDWSTFVDRWGASVGTALLVVMVSLTATRLHPSELGRGLAGPQLLLLLIVLACIAVLAYRDDPS